MEIDLSAINSLKTPLVLGLFAIATYTLLWPIVRDFFKGDGKPAKELSNPDFKRTDSGRSSDTPPPEGFVEHLAIIESAAPNADTSVWWEYAKQGLTEAEVALAEAKLARKPSN